MIGTLFRAVFIAFIVLLIAAGLGMFVMTGIAATHEVKSVPVPKESALTSYAGSADYIDAYRAPLEFNSFRSVDRIAEFAFHKGQNEIFRNEREVGYEGSKWGIEYRCSYLIERGTPSHLYFITAADVRNPRMKRLFPLLKFVYRRIAPYRLDRMAQLAPD